MPPGLDDKGRCVSQDVRKTPPWVQNDTSVPDIDAPAESGLAATDGAADPTVGTGSVIALGCIAGTLVLILFGLLYIALTALF